MAKSNIENIIVLDTEFVSSKTINQPFQISISAFHLIKNQLQKISDFNAYIQMRPGTHLTYFAKKYTGITEDTLLNQGIYPDAATIQVVNYLLNFDVGNTLIVGWDPINDKRMIDNLINYSDEIVNVDAFPWFNLVKPYAHFNKITSGITPSLKEACEKYGLTDFAFHNAEDDTHATVALLQKFIDEYGREKTIDQFLVKKYVKVR